MNLFTTTSAGRILCTVLSPACRPTSESPRHITMLTTDERGKLVFPSRQASRECRCTYTHRLCGLTLAELEDSTLRVHRLPVIVLPATLFAERTGFDYTSNGA